MGASWSGPDPASSSPPSAAAAAAAGAAAAAAGGAATPTPAPACPVVGQGGGAGPAVAYDVYGRRLDEAPPGPLTTGCPEVDRVLRAGAVDARNNMPLEPNQVPCAGQRRPLPTSRTPSTIPKAGLAEGGTWVYPSPQMFFNALARKGKGGDVREEDMEAVVHAHNSMNEATWQRVLAWEALHAGECGCGPKLLRFLGRPADLSPLARLALLAGGPAPFDRHDWVVDRCGREVRYVIDFYFDEAAAGTPDAFALRVRPALDTPGAALDRARMAVYRACAAAGLPCPVTGAPGRLGAAASGRGAKGGG